MFIGLPSFEQVLGWGGAFLFIISFQLLNPRQTILLWVPGSILFAAHFYLLGSFIAMVTALLAVVRDLSACFLQKRPFHIILFLCLIMVWMVTFLMAEGWTDFLPALGNTFLSFASLNRDLFMRQRLFSAGHQVIWLVFGVFIGSYPLIFQCSFLLLSNVVGVFRLWRC
ncbi:MAG: YgjV family protein [Alphaproteobacteria bacterium]|nr:YgjV family protein [Alphaproteobacteria bacterium]